MFVVVCLLLCLTMSDIEFVVNNMAYTADELHNTNANADKLIDFKNTKTDLSNCLYEALTKKLEYYQPGQKLPVAQKGNKIIYASCQH